MNTSRHVKDAPVGFEHTLSREVINQSVCKDAWFST